jgi:hypothetical protein
MDTGLKLDRSSMVEAKHVTPFVSAQLEALSAVCNERARVPQELRDVFKAWGNGVRIQEWPIETFVRFLDWIDQEIGRESREVAYSLSDQMKWVKGIRPVPEYLSSIVESMGNVTRNGSGAAIVAASTEVVASSNRLEGLAALGYVQYYALVAAWRKKHFKLVTENLAKNLERTLSGGGESVISSTRLRLVDIQSSLELSFRDVGAGISQCVPVITSLLSSEGRIIGIEQPELHLHPRLQSKMGDLLIESALGGNGNTVIAETHSEHLILRILRRLRETTEGRLPDGCTPITPDDIAILYVEKDGSESKVRHIEVTRDGNFKAPWPGGFFEDRLEELF